MDLTLVLQNVTSQSGLLWCGVSGRQLGKLPHNESLDIPLSLISIVPGLQVLFKLIALYCADLSLSARDRYLSL